MKTYRGVRVEIQTFMTSALVADECSASHANLIAPEERAFQYPWNRRSYGPQSWSGRAETVLESFLPTGNGNWGVTVSWKNVLLLSSVAARSGVCGDDQPQVAAMEWNLIFSIN
jgi:hypothetical protein